MRPAATVFVVLSAAGLTAQNPAVDAPHRRPRLHAEFAAPSVGATVAGDEAGRFLDQGYALLRRRCDWQAWRSFREAVHRDDGAPLAWLGLSLAMLDRSPRRAVEAAWAARSRLDGVRPFEVELVTAVSDALGADARPDRMDPRHDAPFSAEQRAKLAAGLRTLGLRHAEHPVVGDVAARLDGRGSFGLDLDDPSERRLTAAWIDEPMTMPFLFGWYERALAGRGVDTSAWPRHPSFRTSVVGAKDGPDGTAGMLPRWTPPVAPELDLPRGLGGRRSLADYDGKPVLVVFFLGFGCVHCVEQLHALLPAVEAFRANGIEIVAIGTDDAQQVKASYQMARENGTPPMPFDILCDPDAKAFRAWRAYDEFDEEPLHGTFLVDAERRVRWGDVSLEPFMDTGFLLTESKRLLGVGQ